MIAIGNYCMSAEITHVPKKSSEGTRKKRRMMPVYVDDAFIPYGRMIMCHMVADTEDELHEMARKIGMKREWFQTGSIWHYDVSLSKKAKAVLYGAIEITTRELVERFVATKEGKDVPSG